MPTKAKAKPKKDVKQAPEYPSLRIDIHVWEEEGSLLLLRGWKRDGFTDEQIARKIGITPQTLCAWKKRSRLILEALKKSREEWHRELEEAMYQRSRGFMVQEKMTEIREEEGRPTITLTRISDRYIPPSETMQIFVSKHDIRGHWLDERTDADKREQEHRIAKLKKEAEKTEETNEIKITIEGGEGYAE